MQNVFLIILSMITIMSTFALPGDRVVRMQDRAGSIDACSVQNLETLSSFSLESLGNLVGCQGYQRDEYLEYCGCMDRLYGNAIQQNSEYIRFRETIEVFDRQETRIEKFARDSENVMLATLANYIGSQVPGGVAPFEEGGVCHTRLKETEVILNNHSEVAQDIEGLSTILNQNHDENFLASQGIRHGSIPALLDSFYTVGSDTNGAHLAINGFRESQNPLLRLLGESVGSIQGPGSELMQRISSEAAIASIGSSIGINSEIALSGICENIAKRFESARSTQYSHNAPIGEFVDVLGHISEKSLIPTDMEAFRGLRSRFMSKTVLPNDGQALFFGQLMCSNLDRESFGEIEGSDDPEISALTNIALVERVRQINSLIRVSGREYEAAEEELDAVQRDRELLLNRVNETLSELGISREDFTEKYNSIENERDILSIVDELLSGSSSNSEAGLRLLQEVSDVYSADARVNEIHDSFDALQITIYNAQMHKDSAFNELASRVGGIERAVEVLGSSSVNSDSMNYFERFAQSDGFFGPVASDQYIFQFHNGPSIQAALTMEETDRVNAQLAVEALKRSPELSDEDRVSLVVAVESTNDRTHSRRRISSFVEGKSTVGKISSVLSSSSKDPIVDDRTTHLAVLPKVDITSSKLVQQKNSVDTTVSGFESSGILERPNEALAEVAAGRARSNVAESGPLRTASNISSPSEGTTSADSAERIAAMATDRISELSERVDRKIFEAEQSTEKTDSSELNTLRRFESELEVLKNKNQKLLAELGPDDRAQTVSRAPSSSFNSGSSRVVSSTAAIEAPVQQGSTAIEVPTISGDRTITSQQNYAAISSQVDSVLASNETDRNLTLSSGSLQLSFREVSSLTGNAEVENISENFLSLSDEMKLAYVERFFAQRGGTEAYIRQEDGTIVYIQLEEGRTQVAGGESVSAASLDRSDLRDRGTRVVTRVHQLSSLFTDFFEN